MALSSKELVVEPAASEGEPDIVLATEALRTDELLPEPASGDLVETGASLATARVSSMGQSKSVPSSREPPRTLSRNENKNLH